MRARHLLVVPAATVGLVLTGMSPATAHDDDSYHDDLKAKVLYIKHHVKASDDGDEAWVKFKYKCKGDEDKIKTTVTLKQKGEKLSGKYDSDDLKCNGHRHWATVEVSDDDDTVENGYARVTVTFKEKHGDELDREKERVYVYGVDEDHDEDDEEDDDY